jgi:hypothetical protein
MTPEFAKLLADIAIQIRGVETVDDRHGVVFWGKPDVPGCFFCNAVRFGLMSPDKARRYQYHHAIGWEEQDISKDHAAQFLYLNSEPPTGETYYQHAVDLLNESGYGHLLEKGDPS